MFKVSSILTDTAVYAVAVATG